MDQPSDLLTDCGLRFFGQMSAANAHEIKNALAVINENAGLLEDLAGMADSASPLDPARLRRLAAKIKQQVERADHIARSTNRLAHSVEQCFGAADLEQSLMLVVELATRFAALRDVDLKVEPQGASMTLPVRPFILLHLLWLCLHAAIKAVGTGRTLHVAARRTDSATEVRFGAVPEAARACADSLEALPEMDLLLRTSSGRLRLDTDTGTLVLMFTPKNTRPLP